MCALPFFSIFNQRRPTKKDENDDDANVFVRTLSGQKKRNKLDVVVNSVQNNNDDGSCGTVVFAKSDATTLFGDGRVFPFFFALV